MYCIIQKVFIFALLITNNYRERYKKTNKDEHYYIQRIGGYFKSKRIYI